MSWGSDGFGQASSGGDRESWPNATVGGARAGRTPRRLLATTAFLTLLIATTTAQAQLTEPPDTSSPHALTDDLQNTPQENPKEIPDTSTTPVAEEKTEEWKQIGGALFPTKGEDPTQLVDGSPTKYEDNLFDVDFTRAGRLGMTVGATCGPDSAQSDPDADQKLQAPNCHPVAYLFTESDEDGEVWSPLAVPGANNPGYIAAVAWLDANTAIAVGGSGTYPRREAPYGKHINGEPCTPIEKNSLKPWQWNCDQAGTARAWRYDANEDEFCEMGVDSGCPALPQGRDGEPAHGLTAVDFKQATESEPPIGFAGGLGQIFAWHGGAGGAWDPLGPAGPGGSVDNESPGQQGFDTTGGELWQQPTSFGSGQTSRRGRLFRFRVREIRFAPIERVRAYAVTSGCCSPYDTTDRPLFLTYSDRTANGSIPAQWFLHQTRPTGSTPADPDEPADRARETSGQDRLPKPRPESPPPAHKSGLVAPESFYSLTTAAAPGGSAPTAVLASTASTDSAPEQRSEVWGCHSPSNTGGAPSGGETRFNPSTARLVAIDGWVGQGAIFPLKDCASMPEWAVGELRSQLEPDHGRRGLVSQTKTSAKQVQPTNPAPTPEEAVNGWEATSEDQIRQSLETLDYLTTSYTLNSLQLIAETSEGWAVGDHGALVRLGSSAESGTSVNATEPQPPRLGSKATRELPERAGYATPAPAERATAVPSLGARPKQALEESKLVGAGSPDVTHSPTSNETEDVAEIVMSRDGSEGWAIGTNPPDNFGSGYGTASFYHYDGTSWTRCDPRGVSGQLAPDRACSALAGLKRWLDAGKSAKTTQIVSAARVPLENDDVPTNDDEFEVVAIGTVYMGEPKRHVDGQPVILRYSDGGWDFEDLDARQNVKGLGVGPFVLKDIAFTAPDDGWILADDRYQIPGAEPGESDLRNRLFHFDGTSWTPCLLGRQATGADSECGSDRIPLSRLGVGEGLRLLAAGGRVYIFGDRAMRVEAPLVTLSTPRTPLILYHERGEPGWTDGQGEDEAGGGYDPGWNNRAPGVSGTVHSLAVNQNADGSYSGWAQVRLYDHDAPDLGHPSAGASGGHSNLPLAALLMRLEPGAREWQKFHDEGALADYMTPQQAYASSQRYRTEPHLQALATGPQGSELAVIAQRMSGRIFSFDEGRRRWELLPSDRPGKLVGYDPEEQVHGQYQALAPDNQGGFWAAVKNSDDNAGAWPGGGQVFFYHYTDHPPQDVFTETPQPFGDKNIRLTGLAGAPDGSLWATTDSSTIARYERGSGWQTAQIPGWDPGRVVTRSSEVNAIAAAPDGSGVAVGRQGRIANLTPSSVQLDDAASVLCEGTGLGEGCGTSRDLRAVSVAPGGSALAGGDAMALLWRPDPDTAFARISPPLSEKNNITGISMPTETQAWITTHTGLVLSGQMSSPGNWSWRTENKIVAPGSLLDQRILGSITQGTNLPLRAIAIDPDGHGYAVGDQGLVLERTGEDQPWRRLRGPGTDHLTSVTLGQAEGQGALIGGRNGVVWTAQGSEIQLARPADYIRDGTSDSPLNGPTTGPVVAMALLPGFADGETEAWVAIQERGPGTNRLLHYTNAAAEPLLDPASDADPLADAPPERAGELRLAAYGKSDCLSSRFCPPMIGSGESNEVALSRIADAVEGDSADLALFTGDAADSTGITGTSTAGLDKTGDPTNPSSDQGAMPTTSGARKHRRFAEFAIDPLEDAGIPMLGAIGPGDLSRAYYQGSPAAGTAYDEPAKTGENLAWREGLAEEPGPWGTGDEPATTDDTTELAEAAGADDQAQPLPEATVDPETEIRVVNPVEVKNGARTHYAADLLRDGEPQARIVVVDSSLRNLTAADGVQNPIEADGQVGFLERMLCFRGQIPSSGIGECTREQTQEAIVASNTPTYSYGPVDPTALATDGAALESLYLRYRVSAVISGRLGWNGLYYALRPGLHTPCPGDKYPESPPKPGASLCESVSARLPANLASLPDPEREAKERTGTDVSEILGGLGGSGIVPFVVASGAGGKFGPDGNADGSASEGFWHGYTLVRIPQDGDPRGVIVEQRPILDTLAIEGERQVLSARQRLRLRGVGREPIAIANRSNDLREPAARYNEIQSQAVTHRYDLLLADPEKPWLACRAEDPSCTELHANLSREQTASENPCSPYLCLPKQVGTIDPTTGEVRAGDGRYPDTQALALLSVGERSATYPVSFKRSPSFVAKAPFKSVGLPQNTNTRPTLPPNNPSIPEIPTIPKIEVPAIPAPPAVPNLSAATPPELQPPAPPAPPPPSQQPTPLDLSVAPPGVSISTPTALIQPPTPPVNPAPPGGARREARQRQAAAQKGGAEGDTAGQEGSAEGSDNDLAQSPMTRLDASFTRRDRVRPAPSFSAYRPPDEGSPLGGGVLYASGIALLAFALAAGWRNGRPGPRPGHPELPAPAVAAARRRRW